MSILDLIVGEDVKYATGDFDTKSSPQKLTTENSTTVLFDHSCFDQRIFWRHNKRPKDSFDTDIFMLVFVTENLTTKKF